MKLPEQERIKALLEMPRVQFVDDDPSHYEHRTFTVRSGLVNETQIHSPSYAFVPRQWRGTFCNVGRGASSRNRITAVLSAESTLHQKVSANHLPRNPVFGSVTGRGIGDGMPWVASGWSSGAGGFGSGGLTLHAGGIPSELRHLFGHAELSRDLFDGCLAAGFSK